jgi:hypothetical protein
MGHPCLQHPRLRPTVLVRQLCENNMTRPQVEDGDSVLTRRWASEVRVFYRREPVTFLMTTEAMSGIRADHSDMIRAEEAMSWFNVR